MDSVMLKKLFGSSAEWQGACELLVDAETTVKTMGQDSILNGGIKTYAPRIVSGRLRADAVSYLSDTNTIVAVQRTQIHQHTGEEVWHETLVVLDASKIVGVEFESLELLSKLGLKTPPYPTTPLYAEGALIG